MSIGWKRYAAPAAFLLAVTIAVVLVRSGLESGGGNHGSSGPVTTASSKGTTTAPLQTTTTKRPPPKRFYAVQAGDTFSVISRKTHIPVAEIQRLNPNIASTSLHIGERVRIKLGRLAAALAIAAVSALVGSLAARADTDVPPVSGAAFVVEDARTGDVLASSSPHERLPIASITKLMTVLVVLDHIKPSDIVDVDKRAAGVGEESIFLESGEHLTVGDLIKGALIQSANDAADALALAVAPSFPAFAQLMNAKAAELGLNDTHFVRPDGLDAAGAYSSAADVTTLARAAMRLRIVRDAVGERTDTIAGNRVLHTWDDLLGVFPNVLGVKTGHTGKAGWCQVVAVRGRGVTVYVTLLGSPSRSVRNAGLESLLSWGLAQFRVVAAIDPSRVYARVGLPYGRSPLRLHASRPLLAVARIGRPFVEHVSATRTAGLPVRAGEVLGHVEVWNAGRLVGRRDLVADRTVRRPGLAGRVGWYAGRAVHHFLHFFSSL